MKPILFNTEMIQAILDGKKTVTRRLVKFPINKYTEKLPKQENVKVYGNTIHAEEICFSEEPHYSFTVKAPYKTGDILYVRETWQCLNPYSDKEYVYKASCDNDYAKDIGKWIPSIHMPKEVARIFLKVADLRVERLQDITESQLLSEGTPYDDGIYKMPCNIPNAGEAYLRGEFMRLWNFTAKKEKLQTNGWNANPWVWVIEFERCDKPQ